MRLKKKITHSVKTAPKQKGSVVKSVNDSIKFSEIIKSKWFFPLLCLSLLTLAFTIRKISNYDTGFHLAAGKWILTNLSVPDKDTFTYTVNQNNYLDIQWLYQVIIYFFYSVFNYAGLTIFNSAVIISVFYILLRRMNLYGVPVFLSLLLLLTAVLSMQLRFGYRPEIVTWLFMLLLLYILDRYYYFNKNNLYLLPVIILLWVNMHGLFILGLLIIAAYFISLFIEKKVFDKKLMQWFLISIVAVFINPYFIDGAMFPFYLFTRLQKDNIFRQNITELKSPWELSESFGPEIYLYFFIALISFILIFITFRKRFFHQFALLAALFYISYSSFRNIPLFIIYAVYIIGVCLSDLLSNSSRKKFYDKFIKYEKITAIIFSVILLLICLRVITGAYYLNYNSQIKFGTGIDETILPEESAEFINKNSLDGKIINNLEFGGWLEWRIKQPVFIDGRLEVVREDFYKEYLSGFSKNGLKALIDKFNPSLIIADISNYNWTLQMNNFINWRLIHWDETASVYAKNDYAGNINFNFNSSLSTVGIDTAIISASKDEIINDGNIAGFSDWLSGFYSKKIKPVNLMKMGNFAMDKSQYKTAEMIYLSFIQRSTGTLDELNYSDVYSNLGSVYYVLNDFQRAVTCYEKSLTVNPHNTEIKNRVSELKRKL